MINNYAMAYVEQPHGTILPLSWVDANLCLTYCQIEKCLTKIRCVHMDGTSDSLFNELFLFPTNEVILAELPCEIVHGFAKKYPLFSREEMRKMLNLI